MICFDASNDKIVFLNHEDMSIETIANNFDSFMNSLYDVQKVEAFQQIGINKRTKQMTMAEVLKHANND